MIKNTVKPHRPLGLSLAIIMCGGLFALIPLLNLSMQALVQFRLSNLSNTQVTLPDGTTMQAVAAGGYENLINPGALIIQLLVCLWVIVICVMAWRGKPRGIRWVFTGTVLTLAMLTAYVTLRTVFVMPNLSQGLSSADQVNGLGWTSALFSTVLLPLYTLWYLNRAPARAFFAGRMLYEIEPEEASDVSDGSDTQSN